MRELVAELKELRLHGMATTWAELTEQGGDAVMESCRPSRATASGCASTRWWT